MMVFMAVDQTDIDDSEKRLILSRLEAFSSGQEEWRTSANWNG
jgi:hypothetical protein